MFILETYAYFSFFPIMLGWVSLKLLNASASAYIVVFSIWNRALQTARVDVWGLKRAGSKVDVCGLTGQTLISRPSREGYLRWHSSKGIPLSLSYNEQTYQCFLQTVLRSLGIEVLPKQMKEKNQKVSA